MERLLGQWGTFVHSRSVIKQEWGRSVIKQEWGVWAFLFLGRWGSKCFRIAAGELWQRGGGVREGLRKMLMGWGTRALTGRRGRKQPENSCCESVERMRQLWQGYRPGYSSFWLMRGYKHYHRFWWVLCHIRSSLFKFRNGTRMIESAWPTRLWVKWC